MKNRARIFLVCFILVGGTTLFAFRSLNQFNNALDDLSASSLAVASTPPNSFSVKTNKSQILGATTQIAKTPAAKTDLGPSFVFPKKGDELYMGCTYRLSFRSGAATSSLTTVLVDAGSRDLVEPSVSGLATENKIEPNSQSLDWKVGVFWPGEYYIKATSANGVVFRSGVFKLKWMPKDISAGEKQKLCMELGGSF